MNFTHYDLGNLDKGRMVEIILQGNAANVQLLDSSNLTIIEMEGNIVILVD